MTFGQVASAGAAIVLGLAVLFLKGRSGTETGRLIRWRLLQRWPYLVIGATWGGLFAIGSVFTQPPTPFPLVLLAFLAVAALWPFVVLIDLAGWYGIIEGGRALHEGAAGQGGAWQVYLLFGSAAYLFVWIALVTIRTVTEPNSLQEHRDRHTR